MENATAGLPFLVGVVITIAVLVVLMTYLIMPAVTWLLRPWLSKKRIF